MKKNSFGFLRKALPLLMFILLSALQGYSQNEISISGSVKDAEGTPLAGANILVANSAIGTSTDFDGNFKLNNEDFKAYSTNQ